MKRYSVLLSIALLGISFGFMWVAEYYVSDDQVLKSILIGLGTSGITTAIINFLTDFIGMHVYSKIVQYDIQAIEKNKIYGLIDILDDFAFENELYKKNFINSSELYIVFNDSKLIIDLPIMQERLLEPNKTTTIIITDFRNKELNNVIIRKNNRSKNHYLLKMMGVINDYAGLKKGENHKLNIGFNKFHPSALIIFMDNFAMQSSFRSSDMKTRTPVHIYSNKGSEYKNIKNDVNCLIDKLSAEELIKDINEAAKMLDEYQGL